MKGLVILAFIVVSVHAECPNGWVRFDASCYLFPTVQLDFSDSEDYCIRQGGYLVHIETAAENTFIRSFCETLKDSLCIKYGSIVTRRWIGLTDQANETRWMWLNSDITPTYFNWAIGEPSRGTYANCAVLWESHSYHWMDEPCHYKNEPVCERSSGSSSGSELIG